MTKIAIISQPEQGVLIDVGGCGSLQEATQHLTSTFQVTSQFWEDQAVDLNLGSLSLNREELGQILSTLAEVGVKPRAVYAQSASTKAALRAHNITPAAGSALSASAGAKGDAQDNSRQCDAADSKAKSNQVSGTECGALQAVVPPANVLEEGASPKCDTQNVAPNTSVATAGGDCSESSESSKDGEQAAEQPQADSAPAAKEPAKPTAPHVLYLHQTLRSGQSLSHKGHLVIIGDVNPGAEVIADGDINIWGVLRGVAHAGVSGNTAAEIRALRFDPMQLRIANAIARAPDRPKPNKPVSGPEVARIINGTIRISSCAPD
jgi:septum formation inhibitor MinC